MEKEVWKVYYNGPRVTWEISDQGNVKRNGVPYECKLNCNGYKVFGFGWKVHREVAELFIPNPNNYNEVDHINGNPLDNRATNLKWCTHKENMNNPITRKRNSEAHKNKPKSEETRKRMSEAHKDKPKSEEHKKHIREAKKIYWQNKRNERQTN